MSIKTDRRDAEGIARLLHPGRFPANRYLPKRLGAVLSARKAVQQGRSSRWKCHCAGFCGTSASRSALYPVAGSNGVSANRRLAIRCRKRQPNPCSARSVLRRELAGPERNVRQRTQEDPVCRRLMSMPGTGAVVAPTYRSAVDAPARFASPKKAGPGSACPPRNPPGERGVPGGATRAGDGGLRRARSQAAPVMRQRGRASRLRTRAAKLARRRGAGRAMIAPARRIAVILHGRWKDDAGFRSDSPVLPVG